MNKLLLLSIALMGITASSHGATGTGQIKIDGSSTVFPISEAVAEEFQTSQKGKVKVTVGISGTGGGFKKFCRGETDVQNASRPISKEEMAACASAGIKYLELPIAYDAIAIVANPSSSIDSITVAELKKMWDPSGQGKITKWNQVNEKWPNEPLKLYGAGSDSGTFDYFTEAVMGKAKASRGDYTASEDDNTLVTGIARDKNAIGYIPLAYYEANKSKLKLLAVDGGSSSPSKKSVKPNKETVVNGQYFPLSRPVFIYVSAEATKRAEVKSFVKFYLQNGSKLIEEVKYIPLPEKAYKIGLSHLEKNKVGTVFGGTSEVGLRIEKLMEREAKL